MPPNENVDFLYITNLTTEPATDYSQFLIRLSCIEYIEYCRYGLVIKYSYKEESEIYFERWAPEAIRAIFDEVVRNVSQKTVAIEYGRVKDVPST